MSLKKVFNQILKETVSTTKLTLESIDIDKIAINVNKAKKKAEDKLDYLKNKLDADLYNKTNTESPAPKPSDFEIVEKPIEDLDLSTAIKTALHENDITTVNQLRQLTRAELLMLKGIGEKSADDIELALATKTS